MIHRIIDTIGIAVLLGSSSLPAQRGDSTSIASWLGCYAVTSPTTFPRGGMLPDSFALDRSPVASLGFMMETAIIHAAYYEHEYPSSGYAIRVSYPPVRRLSEANLGWAPVGSYFMVATVWADGRVNVGMKLGRQNDSTLSGIGVLTTDYFNDGADSIAVTARKVPCPPSADQWPKR